MIVDTLKKLQILTGKALDEAKKLHGASTESPFEHDPINWAHLRCADVAFCQSLYENDHYEVQIVKAAPDCRELPQFIRNYLRGAGYDVAVRTEW